ncbi:iron complex transport system permease protein [Parvibaculum indicum]|uniref:FecCD family ABC transporter permease n=1 Tax=Parvibaculum indicum TaxID=562969 RepID=UPI0031B62A0F|nr:iron complex transport system permease protein [Parvibaculum indicum]
MSIAQSASERRNIKRLPVWAVLISFLVIVGLGALLVGPVSISPGEVLLALAGQATEVHRAIVLEIRLPRLLLAMGVGATLAMAGAVLQGYLRNPLADSSVLGSSNAAAFGAVIALYFGYANRYPLILPGLAIGMSLLALSCVFGMMRRRVTAVALILAGLAVGSLAGACISLALNLSSNPFAMSEIAFWLLGSLEDRSMMHVGLSLPLMMIAWAIFYSQRNALDALALGEEAAESMGIHMRRLQAWIVLGVSIGVGAAVAVSGAIGFVGLVVPHLLRPVVGHRPSRLLLPSAIAGALLLTLSDSFVRLLPTPSELRLGVVTAFFGIPFFIYLLMRQRRMF